MAGRQTGKRIRSIPRWDGLTQLALLGTCFLIGTLGGFFFSYLGSVGAELREYLIDYFRLSGQGSDMAPSLLPVVWEVFRWPLCAFLLGFTALGAIGVPVLLLVRGFMLSYAATTFVRLFGLPGMAVSLASFGVTVFLSVPVLFVVAQGAFRASLDRLPDAPSPAPRLAARMAALVPCGGLLVLAAALQCTVMPALLTAVCAGLFT